MTELEETVLKSGAAYVAAVSAMADRLLASPAVPGASARRAALRAAANVEECALAMLGLVRAIRQREQVCDIRECSKSGLN